MLLQERERAPPLPAALLIPLRWLEGGLRLPLVACPHDASRCSGLTEMGSLGSGGGCFLPVPLSVAHRVLSLLIVSFRLAVPHRPFSAKRQQKASKNLAIDHPI
jgi:hypothetical protein